MKETTHTLKELDSNQFQMLHQEYAMSHLGEIQAVEYLHLSS